MPRRGLAVTGQIDKICQELSLTPNQYLHQKRGINFQDESYVSVYVQGKAASKGDTITEWLRQYHEVRGTVAGRMGIA